jgi:diguanylate cyclase (GGDEF)-like protein
MWQALPDQEHLLHRITDRVRQSLELQEILETAAQEICSFLSIDRVKIYQFDTDGSGIVIAESIRDQRLPSLLGLRFPAGDIPPQAREMFVKARQRVIVDVAAQRKTFSQLDCPETGENLAAEDIRYAPVDPCHVQYLLAMGVLASFTIPILHQNRLWGLLAVHHSEPRRFLEHEQQIVQLLINQVSIAIAQSNLLTQVRRQTYHESTINRISSVLHCPLNLSEIRQTVLEETVKALQGSGGRLYLMAEPTEQPAQLYIWGEQPTHRFIEESPAWKELLGWQETTTVDQHEEAVSTWEQAGRSLLSFNAANPGDSAFNTSGVPSPCIITDFSSNSCLQALAPTFAATPIRSVLIIPLQYRHQCVGCLSIFRNGYDTEIWWAGRFDSDERNQRPRQSFEAWCELKTGQSQEWHQDEIKLAQAIGIHLYMAVMQKRVEGMLRHQASHDRLTALPNRLLFDEQLSLALVNSQQRGEMLAVVFLDLDRFKTVNDTLGHAAGDQLLQQVTKRLQACLRECDAVARWGGDEFTLLFPHISCTEDVSKIVQRILDVLGAPFWLEEQELYVTASLGVALAPYDGEDTETLLKNADTAMYRAKQQGKNNSCFYSPEMNTKGLEQLALEADLRKALTRDEFLLYYQPQVDINTGEIVAMEALIRWQHPQLGLVPPNQFIPLAEETGLICPIGEWVFRTACAQHQAWCLAGLSPMRIAVNLSARQFQQQDLVKTIVQILQETQMQPRYLEVEITESIAMQDTSSTIATLQELRQMGVQIAMDDFGTGYSSLSSIKHFPFHTIKIDQSFVRDLIIDPSDAAIAKAVVALGQGLNLRVVAEGVETLAQLNFLRSLECDTAQGYLFSKPLPSEAAGQLLSDCSIKIQGELRPLTNYGRSEPALHLIAEISQKISQSLTLEEIFSTTVTEVRQLLQTDRVFLYRFEPDWSGVVVVESVAEDWTPILGTKIEDTCFKDRFAQYYGKGRARAIEDIYQAGFTRCYIDFLAQFQVRANLVVPVLQGEKLWGLLTAQQCQGPRQWQRLEISLLNQLATQAAIAIQQAELYQRLETATQQLQHFSV